MKKKLIPLAVAIIIFAVFTFLIPKESLSLSLHETTMTISHVTQTAARKTEDAHLEIDLTQVVHVTSAENIDLGEMVNGVKTDRCLCGAWKNGSYGEYQLYIYQKVRQYTVIEMTDGKCIVVNMESGEMTESFRKALEEYLETLP